VSGVPQYPTPAVPKPFVNRDGTGTGCASSRHPPATYTEVVMLAVLAVILAVVGVI
jgi:hypothetical protein